MGNNFRRDSAGIKGFLQSGALAPGLHKEAEQLRAAAAAAAPRGLTDSLADSYKAETTKAPLRPGVGRVYNDAPYALAVEFGHRSRTGKLVPGAHTLRAILGARSKRRRFQ